MNPYAQKILALRYPRWNELPSIELYMDQVLSLLQHTLSVLELDPDSKAVTSTMINNYVKQKLVEPPQKKRYQRNQLARLYAICTLKRCFSIAEIYTMIHALRNRYENYEAYDLFCQEMENALSAVFAPQDSKESVSDTDAPSELVALQAVTRACANKVYAQTVMRSYHVPQHCANCVAGKGEILVQSR